MDILKEIIENEYYDMMFYSKNGEDISDIYDLDLLKNNKYIVIRKVGAEDVIPCAGPRFKDHSTGKRAMEILSQGFTNSMMVNTYMSLVGTGDSGPYTIFILSLLRSPGRIDGSDIVEIWIKNNRYIQIIRQIKLKYLTE
jgi:hypothetical protein